MKKLIVLLSVVSLLMTVTGCEEKGQPLQSKCQTCIDPDAGGGEKIGGSTKTISTRGIYRDKAYDHVATIDGNGRVIFWDNYYQDREVEQRGYVQTQVRLLSQYREANACVAAMGTPSQHNYSFSAGSNFTRFTTSCGDARWYNKFNGDDAMLASLDAETVLYSNNGNSITINGDVVTGEDGAVATIDKEGFLLHDNPECDQEFFSDDVSVIILSSPVCEDTGIHSGIYTL